MIMKYWPGNFKDPRLVPHYADGRKFLENTKTTYDAILIGVPYPSSLPLNRYFTEEFFRLAKQKLSKEGILALSIPGSLVYVSSAMGELNAIIKKTLSDVFPYSTIIPGDENIVIASRTPLSGKNVLKTRLSKFSDKTLFISKGFIDYALDPQKHAWIDTEVSKYISKSRPNRDFYPGAMTASLIWWQSIFAPNATTVYTYIIRYYWVLYILPLLWLFSGRSGAPGSAFSSGFCAMGLQMASIWGLQVSNGNIYQYIGIINALFMAGTAAGPPL